MRRPVFLSILLCATLVGQEDLGVNIVVDHREVVSPTVVRDKSGKIVNGLEAKDFVLYDNNIKQSLKLETEYSPISMVIAIQANASAEALLPVVKKIGPLVEGLLLGSGGEAALLKFDHRLMEIQSFTGDGRVMAKALEKVNAGSSSARMIDAAAYAARMLRNRPKANRKVLLMITETRDMGSEGKLRDSLTALEFANATVYTINLNRAIGLLTQKMPVPRPDPFPAGSRPVPGGAPMTPTTTDGMTGYRSQTFNIIPVFEELAKQMKGLILPNPVEVLTRYTGGHEYSFLREKDMQQVMSDLGEELHSQYMLSYAPDAVTLSKGGWHEIRVGVVGRPSMKATTRDGYWMAAVPNPGAPEPARK